MSSPVNIPEKANQTSFKLLRLRVEMMIPEWLQDIVAFCFFVSFLLLLGSIDNYKRLKKKFYALRNYKLTHEHPEIAIGGGMSEGEHYVSAIENGQKIVCFFKGRSEAVRFYKNARKNELSAHCGQLIDDMPFFPSE